MSDARPVLVSWIAVNNDPFERERGSNEFRLVDGERVPGPTLTLLFDDDSRYRGVIEDVVFLYRMDPHKGPGREKRAVDETLAELKQMAPELKCHTEDWQGDDPTDHLAILEFLRERLPKIRRRFQGRDLVLHISPGTPSMQTIWILMAETGYIQRPFHTVKSYSKADRRGNPPVVPVELGIETFYKIYQAGRPRQVASEDQDVVWDPQTFHTETMRQLFEEARRFAQLKVPVLLLGERGTGKTTIARWMRGSSPFRKEGLDKNWPAVACGQYTSDTLASELFGHVKGAFTGAVRDKDGLLAKAAGDTLFLDEIGDLTGDNQRRIIKAVEEKTYYPVGSDEPRKSDFRLITATNLEDTALRERLDPDFLDRISTLTLRLPPLREIPGELDWLWESAYRSAMDRSGAGKKQASFAHSHHDRVVRALKLHPLPGNMRDLFRIAYRILAARNDPYAPLSPGDAVEYGLLALRETAAALPAASTGRAVARAFADGQPLDAFFESIEHLKTAGVQSELKKYMATEVRRISRNTGRSITDLCDQSERTLRKWANEDAYGRNEPTVGSSDPKTGDDD
jgi:DNA-binding NtrC family response regulator